MENVTEVESLDDELAAAKQLRIELSAIKANVYRTGTVMNSILIMQIKMILRGLITKYNNAGLLKGENVTMVLKGRGRHASFSFAYSQGLQIMIEKIEADILEQLKKKAEAVNANEINKEETK